MIREGYTLTDLANFYSWSHGKFSSRNGEKIVRVIPHHTAGTCWGTMDTWIAHLKSSRLMSPHVAILSDGTVFAMVPEEMRSWCTGGEPADCGSLTMEIVDAVNDEPWTIGDEAYKSAVAVLADWCKRYNIEPVYNYRGSGINMHRDWANTSCPGTWLADRIKNGQLEKDIRAAMGEEAGEVKESNVLYRVQFGAFKIARNAAKYRDELRQKGFDCFTRYNETDGYYRVQLGAFRIKNNALQMQQTLLEAGYKTIIKKVEG